MTAAQRARPFFGRGAELTALLELVDGGPTRVTSLHGIAGIGKSELLAEFAERAGSAGATVLGLDCRAVEPTERGFLAAAGDSRRPGPGRAISAAAPVSSPRPLRGLQADGHLAEAGARAGAARRRQPRDQRARATVAGWFALGVPDAPTRPARARGRNCDARAGGSPWTEAPRLNRIARGHPLALTLATAGAAEHPELALEDAALTRVVDELSRLYLEDVQDELARRALEAASVVRRATEPVLSAMLEQEDGAEALRRLLDLPFVDAGRDGLVVHEAVRDAIARFLSSASPNRYRAYRRAAWRALRAEAREAGATELWRYTADMLYLIDNPVVREAFFPSGTQPLAVEPAAETDAGAIASIAGKHEGPEAAALLERWWTEEPETFSVVRDRDGTVAGFLSVFEGHQLKRSIVGGDPILEAWARDLAVNPLPKGQVALGLRRWLDADAGEGPCATQAAAWLDVKRTYMALRPALRRMYVVVQDVPTYWPVVEKLGFRPLPDSEAALDGTEYASVVLDFGPGSVDGWLASLVADELGIEEDPELDEEARELAVDGKPVPLTPLEYGLFRQLREHEGKTVTRRELLRDVWGTEYAGGSNVVDAAVRSLRRKLGAAALVVETVRGSGYRLRPDWRAHLS